MVVVSEDRGEGPDEEEADSKKGSSKDDDHEEEHKEEATTVLSEDQQESEEPQETSPTGKETGMSDHTNAPASIYAHAIGMIGRTGPSSLLPLPDAHRTW